MMGTSPDPSSSILALSTPIASSAESKCSHLITPFVSSLAISMDSVSPSRTSAAAAGIRTSPSPPKSPGDSAALSTLARSSFTRSAAPSSSPSLLSMLRSCSRSMSSVSSSVSPSRANAPPSVSSSFGTVPGATRTKYLPSPARAGHTRTVSHSPEWRPTPTRVKLRRTVRW